jgi:HK97 gp10 family phage protein
MLDFPISGDRANMSEDIMAQVERLSKKFDAYAGHIVDGVSKALVTGAIQIEGKAKQNAPVGVSGNLRRSIVTSPLRTDDHGKMKISIGPTVAYGAAVEFGTSPHTTDEGSEDFVANITLWGQRKGMDEHEIFELIDHIRKFGTKPHPYLMPAYYQLLPSIKENIKHEVELATKGRL